MQRQTSNTTWNVVNLTGVSRWEAAYQVTVYLVGQASPAPSRWVCSCAAWARVRAWSDPKRPVPRNCEQRHRKAADLARTNPGSETLIPIVSPTATREWDDSLNQAKEFYLEAHLSTVGSGGLVRQDGQIRISNHSRKQLRVAPLWYLARRASRTMTTPEVQSLPTNGQCSGHVIRGRPTRGVLLSTCQSVA